MAPRRIKRKRGGGFVLRLPSVERDLLRALPEQLRQLLADGDDPSLRRLFPPAYVDNDEYQSEYRRLMGDDLRARHAQALDVLEETVDADELSEEQAMGWLRAVNELRLVLGTRLDVSEEDWGQHLTEDDPRAPSYAVYQYLGLLQEQMVEALS